MTDPALPDFYSPRELTYIRPMARHLTDYEAAICHAQADFGQYDVGDWYLLSPTGRGIYEPSSTALQHPDWFDYRDPSALWQRTYVRLQAEQERAIASVLDVAREDGAYHDIDVVWATEVLGEFYEAFGCLEWGAFMALTRCVREALSDTLSMALVFGATDHLRHQQDIALFSLELEEHILGYRSGLGRQAWLENPLYQPARRLLERLMALDDWGEIAVVTELLLDPLLCAFVTSAFLRRSAPLNGDVLTPLIVFTVERDRTRNVAAVSSLVRLLLSETDRQSRKVPAEHNRTVIQGWIDDWAPMIVEAVEACGAIFDAPRTTAGTADEARHHVVSSCERLVVDLGLEMPKEARR